MSEISSVRISDVTFKLSRWASSSGTRGAITRATGWQGGRLFRNRPYTEELGEKYGVEWGNAIPIPTTWRLRTMMLTIRMFCFLSES